MNRHNPKFNGETRSRHTTRDVCLILYSYPAMLAISKRHLTVPQPGSAGTRGSRDRPPLWCWFQASPTVAMPQDRDIY